MKSALYILGVVFGALGFMGWFQARRFFEGYPMDKAGKEFMAHMDSIGHLNREVNYYLFFNDWGIPLGVLGLGLLIWGFLRKTPSE